MIKNKGTSSDAGRDNKFDLSNWDVGTLLTDKNGNTTCILGYRKVTQPYDNPFYAPSVATHDSDGPTSRRFVELRNGALFTTSLPRSPDEYTVRSDIFLVLPRGAESFFGVLDYKDREIQLEITRQLFGGTRTEIEDVAKAFSRIIGRDFHDFVQLPRITFSKSRHNGCDLSDQLIPSNFPYLAFDESNHAWGHISLNSFFRLLNFMCPKDSAVRKALESEVDKSTLEQLINARLEYYQPLAYERY